MGIVIVPDICTLMSQAVRDLDRALRMHIERIHDTVAVSHALAHALAQFQTLRFNWRNLLVRQGVAGELAGHLEPIDVKLQSGFAETIALRDLARQALAHTQPFDAAGLMELIRRLAVASDLSACTRVVA
jgi:hypothetical protein